MGRRKRVPFNEDALPDFPDEPKHFSARDLKRREDQLIALTYDLVERRIRNGTATSQETVEFLRRGSVKARLEKEIMEEQKKYMKAKTEAMESAKRVEELYSEAMAAFRSYQSTPQDDEIEDGKCVRILKYDPTKR